MKYCIKCGCKLDNNSCPNCSGTTSNSSKEVNPSKVINKMSKKNKIRNLSIFLVAAIIVISYFIIASNYDDKAEVAGTFSTSISNKNSDMLQEVLYSSDERLTINKENALVLIDYFDKNPSKFNEVDKIIKNDINNKTTDDTSTNKIILKEIRKDFLIFPVYKVCVEPTFIKVKTNFKDVKVKIGETVYSGLIDNNEIGPLIPGQYSLNAEISNDYFNKNEIIKVDTFTTNNDEVELFKDLKTVNISSDIPDATLYVNNKNTGVKVKDAKDFGPVDNFITVHAVYNKDSKDILSSKYEVNNKNSIFINFKDAKLEEDDFKNNLYSLMRNYSSSFAYAVNYNSYNYINNYIEYASPMYSKQSKAITQIHNANIKEGFENMEILSFKYDKEKNIGEVRSKETYSIAKDNNVPKVQEFTGVYTFKKNSDGSLILTDINDVQ